MKIRLPNSGRQKALVIVDVQPKLFAEETLALVPYMAAFIKQTHYAAYIEATWESNDSSMLAKQGNCFLSFDKLGPTAPEILRSLETKKAPHLKIHKNTRSCFEFPQCETILKTFKALNIEELHFIGCDINDCVLASAYDSIDLGFYTYVIEELAHHYLALTELKEAALKILRRQKMTNNSLPETEPGSCLVIG